MHVRCATLVSGSDGGSCFGEIELSLTRPDRGGRLSSTFVSEPLPGTGITFVTLAADADVVPAHPAPRRQVVVILQGAAEVETSDGEVRRFSAGDVILAEDVTGTGHVIRRIEAPLRLLTIPMGQPESDQERLVGSDWAMT